jgi:hypothetical protein
LANPSGRSYIRIVNVAVPISAGEKHGMMQKDSNGTFPVHSIDSAPEGENTGGDGSRILIVDDDFDAAEAAFASECCRRRSRGGAMRVCRCGREVNIKCGAADPVSPRLEYVCTAQR